MIKTKAAFMEGWLFSSQIRAFWLLFELLWLAG